MNEETKQQFTTVNQLSKYAAMLLFIAMPFVGLYVGYMFAPEKVVEVERVVEVEKEVVVEEKVEMKNSSEDTITVTDVTHFKPHKDIDKKLPVSQDYKFTNGNYEVAFTHRISVAKENYISTPVEDGIGGGKFQIELNENDLDLFRLNIHPVEYCRLGWCFRATSSEEVLIGDYSWVSVIPHNDCYIAECPNTRYDYYREFGAYVAYLSSETPLDTTDDATSLEILESLSIELIINE